MSVSVGVRRRVAGAYSTTAWGCNGNAFFRQVAPGWGGVAGMASAAAARGRMDGGFRSFSSNESGVMNVFDARVKVMHKDQAARVYESTSGEFEYLRDTIADQLVDRVNDIAKDMETCLDLGCNTGNIFDKLIEHSFTELDDPEFEAPGGIRKVIQVDPSPGMVTAAAERARKVCKSKLNSEEYVCALNDTARFVPDASVDIILSCLSLHWANDLTGTLQHVRRALRPDGAFIGAMFCGDTLYELRTALAIAEQEREGGISAHVSPMLRAADACGLLSDAGFTLSTIDTTSVEVEYRNAFACMEHLSAMGESNAVLHRRPAVSRETMLAAAAIYQDMFGREDGYVPATFEIVFMIGWNPHESQPKPMARGAQDTSLADLASQLNISRTKV
mmetsp:Transcript_11240/g.18341  ORF Transcript_11240/g.18341 Transcript_11240/m.18341 type:complete len:390 (-) Transcript_11240:1419-2588(-)